MPDNGTITLKRATDKDLVDSFKGGDDRAFEEMYRRYHGRVRLSCLKVLHNSLDADEAAQEAFMRAYRALDRFNGQYQLGAWLGRIATNVSIDLVRARNRGAVVVPMPMDRDLLGTEEGPEEAAVNYFPRVHETLHVIQPLHAHALKLRAVEGMSHEEMAGRLQMSPGQVKALLHRARRSFRRVWDKAEGWALAPVVGIRSLFASRSNNSVGDSSNLAAWASMPVVAERVAASALIVAVAVGGMGIADLSGSGTTNNSAPYAMPGVQRQAAVGDDHREHAPDVRGRAAQADPSAKDGHSASTLIDKVRAVVGSQSGQLTTSQPKEQDAERPRERDGGPLGEPRQETKTLQRKVRKIVGGLPPPPSPLP